MDKTISLFKLEFSNGKMYALGEEPITGRVGKIWSIPRQEASIIILRNKYPVREYLYTYPKSCQACEEAWNKHYNSKFTLNLSHLF